MTILYRQSSTKAESAHAIHTEKTKIYSVDAICTLSGAGPLVEAFLR